MRLRMLTLVTVLSGVGCAGAPATTGEGGSALTERPPLELSSVDNPDALPARLLGLLAKFEGDPELHITAEGRSFSMQGRDPVARAIVCRAVDADPDPNGFAQRTVHACTLTGFDATAHGGELPSVIVPRRDEAPLAGKLVLLLERGTTDATFGVKTIKEPPPPCCDIPSVVTYELSDAHRALVCRKIIGGFAAIVQAGCTYTDLDLDGAPAPNE